MVTILCFDRKSKSFGGEILAPSSRLLQKTREAKIVHNAMNMQKEVIPYSSIQSLLIPLEITKLAYLNCDDVVFSTHIHSRSILLLLQDFESTIRALKVRKKELREKEDQMKEYLQKFDNFLKVLGSVQPL